MYWSWKCGESIWSSKSAEVSIIPHDPLTFVFSFSHLPVGWVSNTIWAHLRPWESYCCTHHSGTSMRLAQIISSLGFPPLWGSTWETRHWSSLLLNLKSMLGFGSFIAPHCSWVQAESRQLQGPPRPTSNYLSLIHHFPSTLPSLPTQEALVLTQLFSLTYLCTLLKLKYPKKRCLFLWLYCHSPTLRQLFQKEYLAEWRRNMIG